MEIYSALTRLDFVVIGLYAVVLLAIGFWTSFRRHHAEDIFLANRKLHWFNIGLTIFGANVSPSMMIGSCSIAYASGMVGSNFEWLAWVFLLLLSMVFLPHYLNTKISTMPEFLERRYGKNCREFLSWYVLFATLWMWIGGTLFIGGVVMNQITDWPYWVCVIILALIATSFTITGGLEAIAMTDTFQSILILVASAILTVIGLVKVGSLDRLVHSVPADFWTLLRPMNDEKFPWLAILLGYPVIGIWFWCTDQTIVQKVLGARSLEHGQLGCIFTSVLKIVMPFVFFLPGIICRVLHPDLDSSDKAYMMMVTHYLPMGMAGLIVAAVISALVSTVDAGLNSFSTIFTLDVYLKKIRPDASPTQIKRVGRIAIAGISIVSVFCALLIHRIKGLDLFSLGQSLISFLAPSMSAVFLVGVLWKRATSTAALATLIFGNIISVIIGVLYLGPWIDRTFWPHFLLLSFYIFAGLCFLMVIVSLLTPPPPVEKNLPTIAETYRVMGHPSRKVKLWWLAIAVTMVIIYIIFN